jgi:hypothetical protein
VRPYPLNTLRLRAFPPDGEFGRHRSGNWDPLQDVDHDSPAGWGKDRRFRDLDQLRVPIRVPTRVPTKVPKRHGTLLGTEGRMPNACLVALSVRSHVYASAQTPRVRLEATLTSPVTFLVT